MSTSNGIMTTPEAARRFLAAGYAPLPLPTRSKRPTLEGWTKLRYDESDIDRAFALDANLGLLVGEPSGGLVDCDLDSPEAIRAAEIMLPKTEMISGRKSAPTSHWWFRVDSPPTKASGKFIDPTAPNEQDGLLLELRSTGGQTVVPPSIYPADLENRHPTAEPCIWHRHGEPTHVETDTLRTAVRGLAAAALLGRHWPDGSRHDASLALAGGLVRATWPDEMIERFVEAVCAAAGDREVRDRLASVRSSAERIRKGENATGWPALAKILGTHGETVVTTVREWLGIRREPNASIGTGRESETSCGRAVPKTQYLPIPPYAPFPTDCLPEPWVTFVKQGAAALKCDEALVALPVLSVLASAIGTTRRIHLGAEWFEPSVLWTCVVQESGGLKSPAAELSVDLVQARQKKQVKEFKEQVKSYKREVQEYKDKTTNGDGDRGEAPAKPLLKRSIVGDVTIEKLSGLLDDNRRGVLLYRDELSGWVGSFTKYKGSAGGSDESNWLSIHRAGAITYDRKTGDKTTVYVPFGAASVTGGIQPGTLARMMTAGFFESGLVARILFCMPPRTPKTWTDAGIDQSVKDQANKSLDALYELASEVDEDGDPRPVVVPLSRPARARMKQFVNEWGLRQFEAEGAEAAALAKLEAFPGRFALIHHCVTRAGTLEDTDPIAVESLEAGITLTTWFAREADRVYRMLRESAEEKDVRQLVELVTRLLDKHGGRITAKNLQHSNSRKYRNADIAKVDLERLVGLELGRWVAGEASTKGGHRPVYFELIPRPTSESEFPGRDSARPHDSSDSRPDDDDSDSGGLHDSRPETPDEPHPPTGAGFDVKPEGIDSSDASVCPPENRESEESCSRADPEGGNPDVVPESAPEARVVQSPKSKTPPTDRPKDVRKASSHSRSEASTALRIGKAIQADSTRADDSIASETAAPVELVATVRASLERKKLIEQVSSQTDPFTLITAAAGISDIVTAIEDGGGMIGLDTETTGLRHHTDRVRLIQLATDRGTFLINVFQFPDPRAAFDELFEVLARAGIVGHNLGFDLPFLIRLGFTPGRVFDTIIASQVMHAGNIAIRHGLKDVAARVLGLTIDKTEQKADWSKTLTPEMLRYAATDAELPLQIRDKLLPEIEAAGLTATVATENAALPGVAWASVHGIGLDRLGWEALAADAEAHRGRLLEQLEGMAPDATSLTSSRNWNSPEQVKTAFASVGVKLETTDDDTLAAVSHPLATTFREYRSAAKLAGTYGTEWLRHVARDGRVYANWKQIGAGASGRMSCKEPNLQQLPRDQRYRKCFTAPEGRTLVKADYSQIELRIAAKITGDKRMMAAYRDNEDLHTLTARALLGKKDVTKADRQLAKAVNFGLLYGQGAKGLMAYALGSFGVSLTEAEATAHRNTFFKTYPGLRKWHNSTQEGAVDTRTLAGRRRAGVMRYTEKLNTPVQGTGADGLKRALALLWERRGQCPGAFPVLFVHDEIVIEAPQDQAVPATEWLRQCMLDGMAPLISPVPVEVDVSVATSWGG